MKLFLVCQGFYGQRITEHLRAKAPLEWQVGSWTVPAISEPVVDEPEKYLPAEEMSADLILHLAETPEAAQLLPALVQKSAARSVIVAVDNSAWLPPGLRHQLRRELGLLSANVVFAEPLCSLDTETVGYGDLLEYYTDGNISRFAAASGSRSWKSVLTARGKLPG